MKIKLPALDVKYLEINTNVVVQRVFPVQEIEAEITEFEEGGIRGFLIEERTENEAEGASILVLGPRGNIPAGHEKVIRMDEIPNSANIKDLSLDEWVAHPVIEEIKTNPQTATEIIDSWKDNFTYKEEDPVNGVKGLRFPQIGALHSIHSHWIVDEVPATVVMPTGTGKTDTMLSVLISKRCSKVLVIVPTDALRTQIAEKFLSLGVLKEHGIIHETCKQPIVAVLKEKPQNDAEINRLFGISNVVVTTINIAGQLSKEMQKKIAEHCEYLFIDEAHHLGAKTWKELKLAFKKNKVLQFTATPFRNDNKAVEGKIIFKYPLKKALENGYFKKIKFDPVSEFDPEKADKAIAEKAVAQLRADPDKHILMARVETITRAKEVFELYKGYTEFNPVQIHTGIKSTKERKRIQADLLSGKSRIVVCVDMLGEGFDLPELKVAAFHDIKKSLAITLQLAGRFTRGRADLGEPTFIANIAEVKVREELKKLYEHEADWNALLEQIGEQAIGEQVSLQQFASGFTGLPTDLPLQNLHPASSTIIYKTKCDDWDPDNFETGIKGFGKFEKVYSGINHEKKVLLIVTGRKVSVDWLKLPDVFNWAWDLYICYWNEETKALYIHSSSNAGYFKSLAVAIAGEDVELITEDAIFRSLAGVKRLKLYNVGLRKQMGRLIRYTMQAGSDVEPGIDEILKRSSVKSNMFGAGYEKGARTSVGCSRKGRIWSRRVINIDALVRWFDDVGTKVLDESIDPDEVLKGTLRPKIIGARPEKVPIRVDWPEMFYLEAETDFVFTFGAGERAFLHSTEIEVKSFSETGDLEFSIKTGEKVIDFVLQIQESGDSKTYEFIKNSRDDIKIIYRGQETLLSEFFNENPPIFWFADGSCLEGNTYIELNVAPPEIADHKIEVWDWVGTNIQVESQGVTKKQDSIQYKVIQKLVAEDYEIVMNDDGSGESADVVAVRIVTGDQNYIEVDLYHCKFSGAPTAGARIDDLYVVCGQVQRSAYWKESAERLFSHLLRRNPLKQDGQEVSRFEKGDQKTLEKISRMSEVMEFRMNVYLVQPGVSKARISAEQKKLLGITDHYLMETYELPFKVIISA
ncbi:MAG: DEAD/DEAH box helicase family protein [Candidatus Yonathbacteria bacterium]|nr:DEAD/DEAH box helicase family protein [Candidatus Yonathbacteria bacterium]